MPTVPTYDDLRQGATTSPDVAYQAPSGSDAQQIAGAQLSDAGKAVAGVGDAASKIALSLQDQANQVKVNDAVNQARQKAQDLAYNPDYGYVNLKGDAALTRPDGQDLPTEYGGKLQDAISDIAGTLGNDAQRRQFQQNAADLQTQFNGQVEQHMLGEFRNHAESVQNGTIDLATNDAKTSWNDPTVITPSLNAAKAAIYQKGQMLGWSASQTQAAMLSTTSSVHSAVIQAALENNNPTYAMNYLDAKRGEMTGDDILKVQGHVTQAVNQGVAMQAVQASTQAATTAIAPNNFQRMTQITAGTESGGRDFNADGTVLQGPAVPGQGTAKGKMQVMDATAANPGHGIAPADLTGTSAQQAAERNRVGTQLLQALVQKYGDPAKAWAAYNAGEGNVDKAIADSQQGAPGESPVPWLDALAKYQSPVNHAQTVAYVQTNMQQLNSGAGVAPRPTELDFVNDAVARLPPGATPPLVKMTRDQASAQFAVITKSLNEQGDNALAAAHRALANSPGMTVEQLPSSIMDPLKQFAPGKLDDLDKYSKALGRGDVVTNLSRYNDIVSNMPQYAMMSDTGWNQLQTQLAPADFKKLSAERADLISGKSNDTSQGLNRAEVSRVVNQNLGTLGIPITGKNVNAEQVGGIRQFVDQSIFQAQQGLGRKLTPAEIDAHVSGLFATNVNFKNTVLGFTTGTSSARLMGLQIGDLPSGAADQIRAGLVKTGNTAPTNTDILNVYRRLHASSN